MSEGWEELELGKRKREGCEDREEVGARGGSGGEWGDKMRR